MRLVQPTMMDLLRLAVAARPDEIAQYEALVGEKWNVDEVANGHYNRSGVKFVLVDDGDNPIVAGGYDLVGPQVWQSWMIGTSASWDKHWISITKATRFLMDSLLEKDARRLQTSALADRELACKWYVKGLKMTPEGIMRGYGVNGEDVATFARLREQPDGQQQ